MCAKTGLHPLIGHSMIAPVDNAESRLAGRERHVVGDDRLGETLQGKRANLFSRYASFERHVDALTEQNLAVLGLAAEPCRDIAHGANRGLGHRVPGANRDRRRALQQAITVLLSQQDFNLLTKVRRALFALIVQNDVSVEGVAAMLGMHRRTLNRRLAEHGTTIAKMLNQVRFQLARQLLSETELPFVEIAVTLNYTDASTFTRAFRSWSGVTPSAWRARRGVR
jgi:AraC-like DNA-binding protein